jgi:hypothetical protein
MSTSILKKITAEAKRLRQSNPKIKWTEAIKKAGAFYRGAKASAIKTTRKAKATYKKGKAVASAVKKGYAVAKKTYTKSKLAGTKKLASATRLGYLYKISGEYQRSYKVGGNQKLQKLLGIDYYYALGNSWYYSSKLTQLPSTKIETLIKKVETAIGKKRSKPKPKKIGALKLTVARSGRGAKVGKVKSVSKAQIKPIKPTFAILNKQNPAFLSSLVDHSTKPKAKIIVYSPALNKYIVVVKYIDMYTVYTISPAQTVRYSELFKVVGTHKATLNRINKKYDIDLIP